LLFFFFNDTATTEIYTLSLHDALPILWLEVPSWPLLPANQGMHDARDHTRWLRQRRPLMELPSCYLQEMTQRKGALAG